MAGKGVVKLGLEFDTKAAIQSYRDLVSEMSKGGADPKAIKQFTAAIEKAETELAQLAAEGSTGFTDSKGIEQYQKKVLKTVTSMQQLALRMQEFSKSGDNFPTSEVKKLEAEIEKLKKKITEAQKTAKEGLIKNLVIGGFSKKEAEAIAEAVKSQEELIARLEEERKIRAAINEETGRAAKTATSRALRKEESKMGAKSDIVNSVTGMQGKKGVTDARVIVAEAMKQGLREGFDGAKVKERALQLVEESNLEKELKAKISKGLEEGFDVEGVDNYLNGIRERIEQLPSVIKHNNASKNLGKIANGKELKTDISDEWAAQTEIAAKAQEDLAEAQEKSAQAALNSEAAQEKCGEAAAQEANKAEQAANGFLQMSDAQKESKKSAEQLEGGFNRLADRLKYMFGFTAMFNRLRQIIRSTFNDIQELDKAYASIAYVTNETVNDLWKTYDEYAGMAEKLGQSTADVIKASAIYRQQGLNTEEALELTTDTMKLATIAGNDYATATQEMTAALRGFKMEMDEGGHVADVYSELAAHAAAKVDDIAQAMSRTASIANSAGMSFENTSAFLTQMIETTQESAENIGTSMKTIIARFTELKENVAGTEDSEFEDLDFNKVDKALKSVGVSLKDTYGQFRNLDDVFLELSGKWDTLDRNTQRYIATVAAGSRQQSRFIAMMDNYERTIELIDIAADSEGKADEQFAKAADTIEFKLNAIKTKWQELKLEIMSSGFVKGLLDKINGVMDGLKNLKMPQLAFMTPFAIMTAKSFILNFTKTIKGAASSWREVGSSITNTISKAFGKKGISVKIEANKTGLKQIEQDINKLNNNIKNKLKINLLPEGSQNIEIFTSELQKLSIKAEQGQIHVSDLVMALKKCGVSTQDAYQYAKQFDEDGLKRLINDSAEYTLKIKEATTAQDKLTNETQVLQARQQGLTNGLTTVGQAMSMATMAFISGANAADSLNVALMSMATQGISLLFNLIPQFITKLMAQSAAKKADAALTALTEESKRKQYVQTAAVAKKTAAETQAAFASTGVGALVIGVTLLVAGLSKLYLKQKERNKQLTEEYQIEQQLNKIKNLQQAVNSAKNDVQNAKEELKTTEELINRFKELSDMQVKTTEEQEEYKNLVDQIRNEYPNIVEYYDSVTGQLIIQEEKTANILKMQKEQVIEQQKSYTMAQNSLADAQIRKISLETNKELKKYNKLSHAKEGFSIGNVLHYGTSRELSSKIARYDKKGLESKQIIEYSLKDLGIDKETFLKTAGYNDSLTSEQWDELANSLEDETGKIYDTIETNSQKAIKILEDEKQAEIQYYKDMKATAIRQSLQTKYENLEDTTAQAIGDYSAEYYMLELDKSEVSNQYDYIGTGSNLEAPQWHSSMLKGGAIGTIGSIFGLGGMLIGGAIGSLWGATQQDNLAKWKDLDEDTQAIWKEVAKQNGHDDASAWYESIRTDDEDYTRYAEDFASVAATYFAEKIAEDIAKVLEDNPKLEEAFGQFGKNLAEGSLSSNERHDAFMEMQNAIRTSGLSEEDQKNLLNVLYAQNNTYKKEYDKKVENAKQLFGENAGFLTDMKGKDLDALSKAIDTIISSAVTEDAGRKYLENLSAMLKDKGPEVTSALVTAIDFTEANKYNWEDFKKNGIQQIMEIAKVNETEAIKMFNDLAKAAEDSGVYEAMLSTGGLEEINKEITGRQQVLEKNQDILEKVMNTDKPLKLTQSELKKLKTAVVELGKVGVQLDLTKYLNGDILSAEEFNNALTNELPFSIKNFDDTISYMIANGAEQALIDQMKEAKESAISFNEGAKETLSSWDPVDRKMNDLATSIEKVDNVMNQFIKDGEVNAESLAIINELIGEQADLYDYVDENLQLNVQGLKELIDVELKDIQTKYEHGEATAYQVLKLAALERQITNTEQEWTKQTSEDRKKTMEDYAKAQEDVIEKQKALNEAIEEYNKLLYGSDNRNSGLDLLYNYKEAISAFSDEMSRAQDILEDSSSVNDAINALQKYTSAAHSRLAWLGAQSNVYDQGLNERRNNLLNNSTSYDDERTGKRTTIKFSDYVKYNANTGLMSINQSLIQNAKIADHWKDYIEKQVDDYNKLYQENLKNQDEIRKLEKEIQKRREDAIKRYADFEKDIAETLKSVYQEQVDNLKEKYDSMKEADDDYVNALQEAIEKQRKLRDRENKWEELAQKEKKLSLMSRDTSGANALETQKLEKEVQKDREQLLDESIDSVIENMQKLAEKQDELRQVEIELKEALLDNTAYWNQQAEQVASGFQAAEDYVEWFKNTAAGLNEQTATQFEVTMNEAREKFNNASEAIAWNIMDDMEKTGDSVKQTINVTADEIKNIVNSTSTDFITAVKNTFETTKTEFNKNMDSAIEKINSATKAYDEACEKARELANEVNKQFGNGGYSGNNKEEDLGYRPSTIHSAEEAYHQYAETRDTGNAWWTSMTDQEKANYRQSQAYSGYITNKAAANVIMNEAKEQIKSIIGDDLASFKKNMALNGITKMPLYQNEAANKEELDALGQWITEEWGDGLKGQIAATSWAGKKGIYLYSTPRALLNDEMNLGGKGFYSQFAQGGMVNYTGPAWVDGSPQRPEAFLSAEDTERIGNAAKLLADIPSLNQSNISTTNASYGDTNVEINLNIDHISSDVDIDTMLERVKTEIVDIARPIGTNVILHQQI